MEALFLTQFHFLIISQYYESIKGSINSLDQRTHEICHAQKVCFSDPPGSFTKS